MNIRVKELINIRCDQIKKYISVLERKIEGAPQGRISIKHINNRTYYYLISSDSTEKVLSKNDSKLIEDLIQKEYLKKSLKALKRELNILDRANKRYPQLVAEDIYDKLSDDRKKYVTPVVLTDEQYVIVWQNKPYKPGYIPNDFPYYLTMRGERVRSKSEMIIADRLYLNGIPYKYECPIKVGDEIIHPDFTILRISDRKILYLEHCGMLDDPKYADDLVRRTSLYALEGIVMGDRLFYTFESSKTSLDIRVVEALINKQFR